MDDPRKAAQNVYSGLLAILFNLNVTRTAFVGETEEVRSAVRGRYLQRLHGLREGGAGRTGNLSLHGGEQYRN